MRRTSPLQTFASSPTMVGAITTLVIVVAVFLAYNANNGLPFVPVYRVSVDVPNSARVTKSNEVRIGGNRVGVVESIEPIRTTPDGQAAQTSVSDSTSNSGNDTCCVAAQLNLKLDKSVGPLPEDSIFRIRYKSTFGLKYIEIVRGESTKMAPDGFKFNGLDDGGDCPLPIDPQTFLASEPQTSTNGCFQKQTEFDAISDTFDQKTRNASRADLVGFGSGFAGRGGSLNEAIGSLSPLFRYLGPVAKNLADPGTGLARFISASGRLASIVAPVAVQQSQLFTNGANAFAAISADPQALQDTISTGRPLLEQGPGLLARERPFLADFAELSRRLQPGVNSLREALPDLNAAINVGTPTLLRTPPINAKLGRVFVSLKRLVQQPSTKISLQRLKETFDEAKPLANWVVPAQTVCNYWNYFFTYLPNGLSDRDQVGYSFRQSGVGFPLGTNTLGISGMNPITIPGQAQAGLAGYSGIQANGRLGGAAGPDANKFAPFSSPILEGHPYGPTGQPFSRDANGGATPDCQPGQSGYFFGQDPVPGQPKNVPAEGNPDIPGSRGVSDVFYNQKFQRTLKDTRIPSHQP
jgi:phospholipid/cholesterol/gamma-HCH transport system substrate-binding protein